MKKCQMPLFSITYEEKNSSIYQNVGKNLMQEMQNFSFLGKEFSYLHFSLNLELPNTIMIQTTNKTISSITEEIWEVYLKTNINPNFAFLIPYLIQWIKNWNSALDWKKIRKTYRSRKYKKESLTMQEENEFLLLYLSHIFGNTFFFIISTDVISKEILTKEMYHYFDSLYCKEQKINSPESIVDYMKEWSYGWHDREQNLHLNTLKDWKESYYIHSVEFLLENQIGCCIDTAKVKSYFLTKLGYPNKTFLIKYLNQGKVNYHAKTFFQKEDIWYHMTDVGIETIGTLRKIKEQNYGDKVLDIVEFDTSIENCSIHEFLEEVFGKSRKRIEK